MSERLFYLLSDRLLPPPIGRSLFFFPFLSLRSVSPFAGPKEGRGGLKGKRRRQRHGRIGSRGNGGKKKKEGTPLHVSGPISDDGKRKREREGQVHSLPGKVV